MNPVLEKELGQGERTFIKELGVLKPRLAKVLPPGVDVESMFRAFYVEMKLNHGLRDCSHQSMVEAIFRCCRLGMEPGADLGYVYLVPRKRQCTVVLGYQGMLELAWRSGQLKSIQAHVVYEQDEFQYYVDEMGQHVRHVPASCHRGSIVASYAIAQLITGGYHVELLYKEDIDAVRQGGYDKVWQQHYGEMAKKTAIRKLFKYLPKTQVIQEALSLDLSEQTGPALDMENSEVQSNESPPSAPVKSTSLEPDELEQDF